MISSIFMIIFIAVNNLFVVAILDKSVELTCNVYYNQISNSIYREMNLLKKTAKKIATDEKVINILDNNRKLNKSESNLVQREINTFEIFLESSSFLDKINIVNLSGDYLFSKDLLYEKVDSTKILELNETFLKNNTGTIISDIHKDYITDKDTISIVSPIYSDNKKLLGTVVIDIFVEDLLKYSNTSFYSEGLDTYILKNNEIMYSANEEVKEDIYSIKDKKNILGDGKRLLFVFDKHSIKHNPYMSTIIKTTTIIVLITSLIISIALVLLIQLAFRPALKSIEKLKHIFKYLENNDISLEEKDEFKQLELISESLGKSFDEKVQSLIYYDDLTKLPNKKRLTIICNELISNKAQFALAFIDLNKFKVINDIFGHSVGDELLVKFGSIMQEALGDKGVITRYSGDEFVIIYKEFNNDEQFIEYYERDILSKFKNSIEINKEVKTSIDFSTGVAVYPRDGLTVDELISKSDFIMHKNKKDNINYQPLFFDNDIYMEMIYIETLKNELKYSCERNELVLKYQPIYDENRRVKKAEVLLRWNSKRLGYVLPNQFIKYAEETRDIIPIGYWIVEEVCKSIKENNWEIIISINVSPIQLMEPNFDKIVDKIIEKSGISYNKLCFEITESALLENNNNVHKNIKNLRKKGIIWALDDFGTGYASFNYLSKYSLDILKIDKIFLDNAFENDFKIIDYIKKFSSVLDMKVIIEGVETERQFKHLKRIKCDLFQGYYFSKPLENNEFSKLIENY